MIPNPVFKPAIYREILLVMGLSLGMSALYSLVDILRLLTAPGGLTRQSVTLVKPLPGQEFITFLYSLLGDFSALLPVALVFYLLTIKGNNPRRALGLVTEGKGWLRQTAGGVGLWLVIGLALLLVYLATELLGFNARVMPGPDRPSAWVIVSLILIAVRAGWQEEPIMIGYLFFRLKQAGWSPVWIVITSALVRGSYHLYQGFGGFFMNLSLGLVFGWIYTKTQRLWPLILAHILYDLTVFLGYSLAIQIWSGFR